MMLGHPCGIEANLLGANDLLGRKAIALRRTGVVEKPGKEAKPSSSGASNH
jgi:hypothetical protein